MPPSCTFHQECQNDLLVISAATTQPASRALEHGVPRALECELEAWRPQGPARPGSLGQLARPRRRAARPGAGGGEGRASPGSWLQVTPLALRERNCSIS